MSDYTSVATKRVEAVNSPTHALTKTVWASDASLDVIAGQLMRTDSTSDVGVHLVTTPASVGDYAPFVVKTPYVATTDDLESEPLEAFVLTPGLQLLIPETALAADVEPHGYLVADTDGKWAANAQATDYVVGEALTAGTAGGDGSFRVQIVLSQVNA